MGLGQHGLEESLAPKSELDEQRTSEEIARRQTDRQGKMLTIAESR